jgi:hypothetical protein
MEIFCFLHMFILQHFHQKENSLLGNILERGQIATAEGKTDKSAVSLDSEGGIR